MVFRIVASTWLAQASIRLKSSAGLKFSIHEGELQMPRVSVVIPAYNAAALLGETLSSVLQSSYRDFDVVVVNDGSTDTTAAVAEKFGSSVRVITQSNAGMSAARNRGIEESDSEFIALLDSDDVWHPEKLKWQVDALDAHAEHTYCFTEFQSWEGGATSEFMSEHRSGAIASELSGWIYHKLLLTNWALPSSLLFRREAWIATGPFLCHDQQTDDWEYLVRASQSHCFLKLAEPFVLYRQTPGSLSRKLQKKNNTEEMRESFITRYGTNSPNGEHVNKAELERRRYLGWSNFADSHCSRGNLGVGLSAFGKLLLTGPRRGESFERLAKSLIRRIIPKR